MSLNQTSRSSASKQKTIKFSIPISLLNNLGNAWELSFVVSSNHNTRFKSRKPSNNESKCKESRGSLTKDQWKKLRLRWRDK